VAHQAVQAVIKNHQNASGTNQKRNVVKVCAVLNQMLAKQSQAKKSHQNGWRTMTEDNALITQRKSILRQTQKLER
jgi:hypothetical protein